MNPWIDLLTADQLAVRHAAMSNLDAAFSGRDKAFYESRTADQLRSLERQAWSCNNAEVYQVARSYLALKG